MTRIGIIVVFLGPMIGCIAFIVTKAQIATVGADSWDRGNVDRNNFVVECKGTVDGWIFRQPGADGEFHTDDDLVTHDVLVLPPHATVRLKVSSDDYLFRLAQQELSINVIAIPNHQTEQIITTGGLGQYELESQSLCGAPIRHSENPARSIISNKPSSITSSP